jgi:hypothetical protein
MDESVWLEAFFLSNVTPLFYVETLADLEKEVAAGRTPESVVGTLAAKTPSNAAPNVHHRTLISGELIGGLDIEMSGRIHVGEGDVMQADDGRVGVHIDEFPEAAALLRWKNHEFLEIERAVAKAWRADLEAHDPDVMLARLRNVVPAGERVSDLADLKAVIDAFCERRDKAAVVLALEVLGLPYAAQILVLNRWQATYRRPLNIFAPYTTHVFKVALLYYLGIERGFISGERASNMIDVAYLYYLPFSMVFVSGDKLHARTAPLFLRDDQTYVNSTEFKAALSELDGYYDTLPNDIKELGVMAFAHYPPSDAENLVTHLWDRHMRSDWREQAKASEADRGRPRDGERDRRTIAEWTTRLDAARPAPEGPAALTREPDYIIMQQQVPVAKGKWRMVSKEIEEAEGQ